jgi:hypothetical protein
LGQQKQQGFQKIYGIFQLLLFAKHQRVHTKMQLAMAGSFCQLLPVSPFFSQARRNAQRRQSGKLSEGSDAPQIQSSRELGRAA